MKVKTYLTIVACILLLFYVLYYSFGENISKAFSSKIQNLSQDLVKKNMDLSKEIAPLYQELLLQQDSLDATKIKNISTDLNLLLDNTLQEIIQACGGYTEESDRQILRIQENKKIVYQLLFEEPKAIEIRDKLFGALDQYQNILVSKNINDLKLPIEREINRTSSVVEWERLRFYNKPAHEVIFLLLKTKRDNLRTEKRIYEKFL